MSIVRPAGWYPDGTNYGQQRWWDGNQWTANVQAAYYSSGSYGAPLPAPIGTSPYNAQIWWIVGIYAVLSVASIFVVYSAVSDPYLVLTSSTAYLLVQLGFGAVGLLAWAAAIVLAAQDGRELESRGVQRPFHWAFTFIPSYGPTIYIIGRSIVVRRRTGSGLAPIWVHLGSYVGAIVLSVFAALGPLMSSPYYY